MEQKSKYYLGVDTADKGIFAYCLYHMVNDNHFILTCDRTKDETEFKQTVETLTSHYNATVLVWN
jgi:hypothetical protein